MRARSNSRKKNHAFRKCEIRFAKVQAFSSEKLDVEERYHVGRRRRWLSMQIRFYSDAVAEKVRQEWPDKEGFSGVHSPFRAMAHSSTVELRLRLFRYQQFLLCKQHWFAQHFYLITLLIKASI